MKNYEQPRIIEDMDVAEGVYAASGSAGANDDCLDVSWWEDNKDGDLYRFVFKVTHKGHQSYGQTVTAVMSEPVQVIETDGTVNGTAAGNVLTLVRDNQLNDNGLVELWVKLACDTHPTVLTCSASNCIH